VTPIVSVFAYDSIANASPMPCASGTSGAIVSSRTPCV
jgi:hypothetical protein